MATCPEVKARLAEQYGVRLTDAAVNDFLQETSDVTEIYKQVLDCDLHGIGQPYLPKDASTLGTLAGKYFVQVAKVRDVTIPLRKSKDDVEVDTADEFSVSSRPNAHRLLRIEVTDGERSLVLVELTPMKGLHHIPVPGTKLLLKDVQMKNGMGLMAEKSFQVLGGAVEALSREYDLQQGDADRTGVKTTGGPPLFVPFKSTKAPGTKAAATRGPPPPPAAAAAPESSPSALGAPPPAAAEEAKRESGASQRATDGGKGKAGRREKGGKDRHGDRDRGDRDGGKGKGKGHRGPGKGDRQPEGRAAPPPAAPYRPGDEGDFPGLGGAKAPTAAAPPAHPAEPPHSGASRGQRGHRGDDWEWQDWQDWQGYGHGGEEWWPEQGGGGGGGGGGGSGGGRRSHNDDWYGYGGDWAADGGRGSQGRSDHRGRGGGGQYGGGKGQWW